MTEDENKLIHLYFKALTELSKESSKWNSNYYMFKRWSDSYKLKWVSSVQQQAKRGVASSQIIVAKATEIRLRG